MPCSLSSPYSNLPKPGRFTRLFDPVLKIIFVLWKVKITNHCGEEGDRNPSTSFLQTFLYPCNRDWVDHPSCKCSQCRHSHLYSLKMDNEKDWYQLIRSMVVWDCSRSIASLAFLSVDCQSQGAVWMIHHWEDNVILPVSSAPIGNEIRPVRGSTREI